MTCRCQVSRRVRLTASVCRLSMSPGEAAPPFLRSPSQPRPGQVSRPPPYPPASILFRAESKMSLIAGKVSHCVAKIAPTWWRHVWAVHLVSHLIASFWNPAESRHFSFPQAPETLRSGWMMTASYFWVTRPRRMTRARHFGGETTRSPSTPGELERKPQRKGASASSELQEICGSEKQAAVTLTARIQLSDSLSVDTLREFLVLFTPLRAVLTESHKNTVY